MEKPIVLVIMDGVGKGDGGSGDAVVVASKKMGIPAMILAVLIAFSRMYLYVHYPTDVIFSIFLGTAFALFGNYLAGRIMEKLPEKLK